MITFNKLGQYGRFGNQLFHIASTIGIAKKYGYYYGFPEWGERKHFKYPLPCVLPGLPEYKLRSDRGLLIEYKDFDCPDNVSLLGHFFSEKYFERCKEWIKYYFEMKEIPGLPEIQENSICIHVRAGDFGTKQFPRLPVEYYSRSLIEFMQELFFEDYKVYVFSDNVHVAKKLIGLEINASYIETGNYIHDFYLMQQCKHFIIANSTYSWWAAWLGSHPDKIVIAPKNMEEAIYTDEMYPKKWIVL